MSLQGFAMDKYATYKEGEAFAPIRRLGIATVVLALVLMFIGPAVGKWDAQGNLIAPTWITQVTGCSIPLLPIVYFLCRWRLRVYLRLRARRAGGPQGACCPACFYPQSVAIGGRCQECGHYFRRLDVNEFRRFVGWEPLPAEAHVPEAETKQSTNP